jgi:L-malate glycosyltransferase
MPINIAFIIDHLPIGGTENQLYELINRIDRRYFEPSLILLRDIRSSIYHTLACKKLILDVNNVIDIVSTRKLLTLVSFLKKNKIQIVQTFFPDGTLVGVLGARLASVPEIIISRRDVGTWHRRNDKIKYHLSNKFANQWLANSNAVKTYLVKKEHLTDSDIKVIPNGILYESFENLPLNKDSKNGSKITVGTISNFNRYVKRLDVFVNAMKILATRYDSLRFLIVGNIEMKHWDIVIPHDIIDKFEFIGITDNVHKYLSKIDIGVNCSDSEGFSNVILEYMASSIPCVCTNCDGNIEIIKDGFNGFLFAPGDYLSLAEKVATLADNKDLRQIFINNSLEKVKNKYDWSNTVMEHQIFYTRIIKNTRDNL